MRVNSVDDAQGKAELQKMLADRFKLTFHRATKETPVYELTVGKNGPKFNELQPGNLSPGETTIGIEDNRIVARQETMKALANKLSWVRNRLVVDKTGLTGTYSFTVDWSAFSGSPDAAVRALREQLGLELQSHTDPVDVLFVDHAEQVIRER
ncbi:MAG TPA: TIGR03435 family protein [Candidatus Acidoferrum sp.]|jgi:uncharacterized protein (TIGR03435 family)